MVAPSVIYLDLNTLGMGRVDPLTGSLTKPPATEGLSRWFYDRPALSAWDRKLPEPCNWHFPRVLSSPGILLEWSYQTLRQRWTGTFFVTRSSSDSPSSCASTALGKPGTACGKLATPVREWKFSLHSLPCVWLCLERLLEVWSQL